MSDAKVWTKKEIDALAETLGGFPAESWQGKAASALRQLLGECAGLKGEAELPQQMHAMVAEMCESLGLKREDVPSDAWALNDAIQKLKNRAEGAAQELEDVKRLAKAESDWLWNIIANAYRTMTRDAWESGMSDDELLTVLHNALCERNGDPFPREGVFDGVQFSGEKA